MSNAVALGALGCLLSAVLQPHVSLGEPPLVFEPDGAGITRIYSSGTPFGVGRIGAYTIGVQLAPVRLANRTYARLWIYCQDDSSATVDFDPAVWLRYTVSNDILRYQHSTGPEPAWSLMDRIKSKAASDEARAMLIGGLSAFATAMIPSQGTMATFEASGSAGDLAGTVQFNDGPAKAQARQSAIAERSGTQQRAIREGANRDASSVSQTVLRRDTLLPGMAVAGFVYFPFPGPKVPTYKLQYHQDPFTKYSYADTLRRQSQLDFSASDHEVVLVTPARDSLRITFHPVVSR